MAQIKLYWAPDDEQTWHQVYFLRYAEEDAPAYTPCHRVLGQLPAGLERPEPPTDAKRCERCELTEMRRSRV